LFCSVRWNKIPSQEALGNFELMIDEDLAAQDDSSNGAGKNRASNNRWKYLYFKGIGMFFEISNFNFFFRKKRQVLPNEVGAQKDFFRITPKK
jgi:hypothetical protein